MEKYLNGFSISVGFVGGVAAYTLGGWDQLLWALLYFMVADYITGLFKAYKTQTQLEEAQAALDFLIMGGM